MKDVSHDHLVQFVGACIEAPNICILTDFAPKGSLEEILECDTIQLDLTFQVSLIGDLVSGMHYLHNSSIGSHGHLKSTNCVVDSRFALKIADYGLPSMRSGARADLSNPVDAKERFQINATLRTPSSEHLFENLSKRAQWTAPELLRRIRHNDPTLPYYGTQKGDVYSFGIILHEIIVRKGTFYIEEPLSKIELLDRVANRQPGTDPLRPSTNGVELKNDLKIILAMCWDEDDRSRPDFNVLKSLVKKFRQDEFGSNDGNLHDKLVDRLETYANQLEDLVKERTQNYLDQRNRADNLLYQIMPK